MRKYILIPVLGVLILACDKKNDDLVYPLKELPQIIKFDDEGDGDFEDEDNFSFVLTLSDRIDLTGEELGGRSCRLLLT